MPSKAIHDWLGRLNENKKRCAILMSQSIKSNPWRGITDLESLTLRQDVVTDHTRSFFTRRSQANYKFIRTDVCCDQFCVCTPLIYQNNYSRCSVKHYGHLYMLTPSWYLDDVRLRILNSLIWKPISSIRRTVLPIHSTNIRLPTIGYQSVLSERSSLVFRMMGSDKFQDELM